MRAVSPAFSFVLVMLAGWMNQRQQQVIELQGCSPTMAASSLYRMSTIALGPILGRQNEERILR